MISRKSLFFGALGLIAVFQPGRAHTVELGHAEVQVVPLNLGKPDQVIDAFGQMADGRLIIATVNELQLHDGHFTETIPLPAPSNVYQVQGLPDGGILVAAKLFMAKVRPDPRGGWQWEQLKSVAKDSGVVWPAYYELTLLKEGLAAISRTPGEYLAGWCSPGGQWTTWRFPLNAGPQIAVAADTGLYQLEDGRVLRRWNGHAWQLDRTLSTPIRDEILKLTNLPDQRLRLMLRSGKLVFIEPDGAVRPAVHPIHEEVPFDVYFAYNLAGNAMAWVDAQNTLRFMQHKGFLASTIDATTGLPPGGCGTITGNGHAQVWTHVSGKVVRINHPLNLTRFDRFNGLNSPSVHALARHKNQLYAGTDAGVYRLEPDLVAGMAHFEPLPGLKNHVTSLVEFHGQLLAGTSEGVFLLKGDHFELIPGSPARVTGFSRSHIDPDIIYTATHLGARRLRLTDQGFICLDQPGHLWTQDILEAGTAEWWLVNTVGNLRHFVPASAAPPPPDLPTEKFVMTPVSIRMFDRFVVAGHSPRNPHAGPLEKASALRHWGETPLAVTAAGLFDLSQPDAPNLLDPATQSLISSDQDIAGFFPSSAKQGWVVLAPRPGGGASGLGWQFRLITRGRTAPDLILPADLITDPVQTMLAEDNVLWIGGEKGLLRVDTRGLPAPVPPVTPALRPTGALAGLGMRAQLPHEHPAVGFSFAIPTPGTTAAYRTRLVEDGEGAWSSFSLQTQREVGRLAAGRYRFEVQARNADGLLSPVAAFEYSVAQPWWWSGWGVAGLIALTGGVVLITMRWTTHRGLARERQLEALIAERTAALRANEQQLSHAKTLAEEAQHQAESANRAKSTFIAAMSHELRTPLNAILGFAQILRRERSLTPKARTQLDVIDRNGQHLLGMINEVLDLSKIEADKMQLQLRPCSLRRLATGLAEMCELRTADKQLSFRLEFGPDVPAHVMADDIKLRQVLINLLGNAIKFTPRGRIVLALSRVGRKIRFEVTDTGRGIPAEARGAIFEPFQQAAPPGEASGTGLGLPISQRLVALMGGKIEVADNGESGSRFWFDLEFAPASPPAESEHPLVITGYTGPRRHVLVVDDIETNRAVLREMLTGVGFEVGEAATGEAALEHLRARPAALVLLDLRLPGMNGPETARQIRQVAPQTRLIAVSASVFSLNHDSHSGCDAFVPKPVDETTLFRTIGEQLSLRWTYTDRPDAASTPAPLPPDRIAALPLPAVEDLHEWLELARGANLSTLRALLDAENSTGPDHAFREQLDLLAKSYRASAIRHILLKVLDLPTNDPA